MFNISTRKASARPAQKRAHGKRKARAQPAQKRAHGQRKSERKGAHGQRKSECKASARQMHLDLSAGRAWTRGQRRRGSGLRHGLDNLRDRGRVAHARRAGCKEPHAKSRMQGAACKEPRASVGGSVVASVDGACSFSRLRQDSLSDDWPDLGNIGVGHVAAVHHRRLRSLRRPPWGPASRRLKLARTGSDLTS